MANLELIRATAEQRPIFENLLELYIHDFSEFHPVTLGSDGRFGYRDLPLYWIEPDHHPFLARIDGELAGFALVRKTSQIDEHKAGHKDVWDMAEFFVLRGMRRRGIGTKLAQAVWASFPGAWQVRVMQSNQRAQLFWASAIAQHSGIPIQPVSFEKDGRPWSAFFFESPDASHTPVDEASAPRRSAAEVARDAPGAET